MLKRLAALALAGTAVAGMALWIAPRALGANDPDAGGLTVHEWGTFTSIAGPDGQAVQWRPLTGPSDLPCFVSVLNPNSIKTAAPGGVLGVSATVRMETPVLYFYASRETTVRASVEFPHGVISEWYPQARVPIVATVPTMASARASITWNDVKISPGAKRSFLTEPGESHYYAARETDAAPVEVAGQTEKFLFYRGLASFPLPLNVKINQQGNVAVNESEDPAIDNFVLFERRGSRFGYRVVRTGGGNVVIERPELTGTMESLRQELRGILTAQGLYPREAAAMVETWRDSWFEEGARLFYVLPKAAVDALLPLRIDPKPASVTRVFVGRLEIVTPQIETEVAQAIRAGDQAVLRKYGRFLEPISRMIEPSLSATHDERKIAEAARMVASRQASAAACPAPGSAKPTASSPPSIQ
jgi:hypothetical protein